MLSLLTFMALTAAHAQRIAIDGSSTVFPITEAVAEEFQTSKRGAIRVTVGISGTGGGFKKFCRGETDIQAASRPILKAEKPGQAGEMESCAKTGIRYFEIPVAFDAAVVVVNKENDFLSEISVEELRKIWEPAAQGKILNWKQVNPKWPDRPLKLYGAGSDSGTFDYFTEAIMGRAKSSRGDYTASEDDNVLVKGVSADRNSLGYLPLAYYEENKDQLKVVPVVPGKGKKAVAPTYETVENGSYSPLSRPLFVYISEKSYKRPEVKEFVEFYLSNASVLVPDVKYVALPKSAYEAAREQVRAGKVGTAFAGHSQVGVKLDELMKKEKSL